jgi:hypothetical protein
MVWMPRQPNQSSKHPPCWAESGSFIPFFSALRLTDFELSAALHARTLLPGSATHCRHCGASNRLRYDEICNQRAPWAVARHEQTKYAIGTALSTLEGVQVRVEPIIFGAEVAGVEGC